MLHAFRLEALLEDDQCFEEKELNF